MASVLAAALSPRRATPSASSEATRLTSSRFVFRGSGARTTSSTRGRARITRSRSPGSRVGAIERPRTSTTSSRRMASTAAPARRIAVSARGRIGHSGGASADPRLFGAAGGLPHLVDCVDHREQLLGRAGVERLLDLGGLLRGLPERLVQVGGLLDVLGLEVVVPQDVEVLLDELGPLLLDVDAASLEQGVVAALVL